MRRIKPSKPRAAVDILVYLTDRPSKVKKMVDALLLTTPSQYNIIFIADKLSPTVSRYIMQLCKQSKDGGTISALHSNAKLGFAASINRGLRATNAPKVVIVREDFVPQEGWLQALRAPFQEDNQIDLVHCNKSQLFFNREILQKTGFLQQDESSFVLSATSIGLKTAEAVDLYFKTNDVEEEGDSNKETSNHQSESCDQSYDKVVFKSPSEIGIVQRRKGFFREASLKKTSNAKLDYIIPICNIGNEDFEDRLMAVNYLLRHFLAKQQYIDIHVVIVEQVLDYKYPTYVSKIRVPDGLDHTIVRVRYDTFTKPWLYNIGVKHCKYEHFIIAESEVLADDDRYLRDLVDFGKNTDWCFGWDKIVYLSRPARDLLIQTGQFKISRCPKRDLCSGWCCNYDRPVGKHKPSPHPYKEPKSGGAEGGMVYFKKKFWDKKLHGANEMFRELGGNDNELIYRASSLTKSYPKFPGCLLHMWHPVSTFKFGEYREQNRSMFYWLKAQDNYKKVCQFLAANQQGKTSGPLEVSPAIIRRFQGK